MVQDANLSIKQFNLVRIHVMHATGISFKMAYRRPELKELEGSRAGPEPQFGTYKNESDNGDTENCLHWSTLMHEELSFAVENEVVNRSTQDSKLQAGPMFPEEIGVIFGLDHGQGALRGYAKFLLTSPQERKERNDLSLGCPIAKICHVQCKKDTYRVVRHTVADKLVEGIKVLNENRLVIVHNKDSTIAQAVYVPMDSNSFRIKDQRQLEFTVQQEFHTIIDMKELDPELQELPEEDALSIDSSIRCFKVYVTGDLAFYALMLRKPNSSNNWCIWCQLQKKFFGTPEMVTDAVKWTLEKLKDAKKAFQKQIGKKPKEPQGGQCRCIDRDCRARKFHLPSPPRPDGTG
jgi:hypothetical protein